MLERQKISKPCWLSGKGMGITFIPGCSCPRTLPLPFLPHGPEQNHLNLYSNYTRAHGVLGIGYHKGRYMSRAAHEFIRIAKERLDMP
ncbi:MAG: hypothetical protein ACLTBV_06685 [Enterocloster bolteae]